MKKSLCVSLALCAGITLAAGQASANQHNANDSTKSQQVLATEKQRLKNADSGLDRFRYFMLRHTGSHGSDNS